MECNGFLWLRKEELKDKKYVRMDCFSMRMASGQSPPKYKGKSCEYTVKKKLPADGIPVGRELTLLPGDLLSKSCFDVTVIDHAESAPSPDTEQCAG